MPLDLLDDDQLLAAVPLDGEGRGRNPAAAAGGVFDGPLDVLRIVVEAADDDQVFEPAGDEKFAVVQEAQVAGAEERALARVCQIGAEDGLGRLRAAASSPGPRWARAPRSRRPGPAAQRSPRLADRRSRSAGRAGSRRSPPARGHRRRRPADVDHRGRGQGLRRQTMRITGGRADVAAGDHQRRLGQAVAGIKRLAAKTARRERLGKPLERLRPAPARHR